MLSKEDKYSLKTKRLSFQVIQGHDRDLIYAGLSDPQITKYYGVHFDSREQIQEQMDWYHELLKNNTGIWWKLVERAAGKEVGACGFNDWDHNYQKAELGYWLLPEYQGSGFMSEALEELIRYGFEDMHLKEIWAEVERNNRKSRKLLTRQGFNHQPNKSFQEIKNGEQIWVELLVRHPELK